MIARRGAVGDLLATLCGVLDQDYQRWELVIVDDGGRREISRLVDAFATFDPRIRVANAEPAETEQQSALSGYDLAQGDYLGLLSPGVRLAADALGRAGYAAAVRGRPELMKLVLPAPTAEVAAPAGLYQEAADEGLVGGLVRRAQAHGARLEVVGSVGGREAGLRTDSVSGDRA
jgi:glycosyltransferase involved in cell wall biosynthesis